MERDRQTDRERERRREREREREREGGGGREERKETKTVNAALCLSHLDQGFSNIFMSRTPKWTHLVPRVPI